MTTKPNSNQIKHGNGTVKDVLDGLTGPTGSVSVGYTPAGAGAVATDVQSKLRESVSVKDFGAVGDGVTDDTAAFAAACASLGSLGGTVHYSARHRIANNLTIPDGVVLAGPLPASAGNTGYANILATAGASLLIDSAATISLRNNSGITGALIQRYGMAWYETSSAAFAGTAVTGIGNDCFLIGCFIAGFNQAFTSVGVERIRCTNVYGDCNNGISVETSWDKTVISGCHFWPFVTQQSGLPAAAQLRSGTAFAFRGVSSYGAFNECFSYGYNRGFLIQDANDCVCTSCGADNNSAYAGSIGFLITGDSAGNNLVGCSTSECDTGYYFNSTNPSIGNDLHASKSWNNGVSGTGVIVNQGNVNISGGHIYNVTAGIIVGNAVSKVNIDSVQFSFVVSAIDATVPTSNVNISDSCIYNGVVGIRGANINPSVRASGVATITTGTSTVTVAHRLGAKPVFYTGAASNTNLGGRSLWFGADATNIYINVSSNVESDAVIMWEARTLR